MDEYLMADPVFFESLERLPDAPSFEVSRRPAPDGWCRLERGVWVGYQPLGRQLPAQGWKIHLSTTLRQSEAALQELWDYCVENTLAFKFLRGPRIHHTMNSKGAHRGSSGKLAAIYPVGDDELQRTLEVLGGRLRGVTGPYVLNDLRWGEGPLYVRFGGFLEQWAASTDTGEPQLALVRPDGERVQDQRRPVFAVPAWAPVPDCVQRQIQQMADMVAGEVGYQIQRAMHHSNAGGVYVARDRSGRTVVLKEARPHAGLDGDGVDAVARLTQEAAVLRSLAGTGVAPELIEELVLWEHHFLVEEFIDGEVLHDRLARTYPYLYPSPSRAELTSYTAWALDVVERVRGQLETLHEHGYVFADLHPANIMLAADGRIVLLDTEVAFDITDEEHRVALGDPGYRHVALAAGGRRIDDYALACLRLALFLPVTGLLYWDRELARGGKAEQLAAEAMTMFPLPQGWDRDVVAALRAAAQPAGANLPSLAGVRNRQILSQSDRSGWSGQLAAAILASATPDRTDRLFPADPQAFHYGPASVAYGAAGVLHALRTTQQDDIPTALVDWLATAAREDAGPYSGLYDGLLGSAVVLAELGRQEQALEILGHARRRFSLNRSVDLFGGAAGRGLGALRLFDLTGDPGAWEVAQTAAAELTATLRATVETAATAAAATAATAAAATVATAATAATADLAGGAAGSPNGPLVPPAQAGLMRGWSGPALLLTRMFEATGDTSHLRAAAVALQCDLARCESGAGNTLHVADDADRLLLYLSSGSIGIGLVLRELLPHLARPDLADVARPALAGLTGALEAIRRTCDTQFTIFPGLFDGRAGVLAGTVLLGDLGPDETDTQRRQPSLDRQLHDLGWHLVPYAGGLALPGVGLVRLSMDLATGTAGALTAVHLATHGVGEILPALGVTPIAAPHLAASSSGRR